MCKVDPRIVKVLEVMSNNLRRPLSVGHMAASVNLSYSRLAHLFKSEMGMTPLNYLKKLRIEKARELLETTFLTNQQIIIQIGMGDESHFTKDFKKAYGLSPRQYREQYHELNNGAATAIKSVAESANR
jgi:transcriptional regulator GlxA family with amidase domain